MLAMISNHPVLQALQAHLLKNFPEYLIFLSALAIATVVTMPVMIPASLQDWWTWMRNALQTAVPAARNAHINVTTPETSTAVNGTAVTAKIPTVTVTTTDPLASPAEPAKE